MVLVALWQLASASPGSDFHAPTPTQSIDTQNGACEYTHKHTHLYCMASGRGVRLSELKASGAMWDVVTLYLITFSQAVMNVAAALSTKAKTCLKHTVHTHTSTVTDACTFTAQHMSYDDSFALFIFHVVVWFFGNVYKAGFRLTLLDSPWCTKKSLVNPDDLDRCLQAGLGTSSGLRDVIASGASGEVTHPCSFSHLRQVKRMKPFLYFHEKPQNEGLFW